MHVIGFDFACMQVAYDQEDTWAEVHANYKKLPPKTRPAECLWAHSPYSNKAFKEFWDAGHLYHGAPSQYPSTHTPPTYDLACIMVLTYPSTHTPTHMISPHMTHACKAGGSPKEREKKYICRERDVREM